MIGDIVEEKISESQSRVVEANVLEVSDDGKEIFKAYKHYKKKGMNALYALPSASDEFLVRNVPVKGILT